MPTTAAEAGSAVKFPLTRAGHQFSEETIAKLAAAASRGPENQLNRVQDQIATDVSIATALAFAVSVVESRLIYLQNES